MINSVYWHLNSFFISFMIMCGLLAGKALGSHFTLHASTKLSLAPWAQGVVAIDKAGHLSMYVFGVVAGFLYLAISAIWCVCQKDLQHFAASYFKSDYFGQALWTYGIFIFNLLLCFLFVAYSDSSICLLMFSAVWLFGFLLPFFPSLFLPNRAPATRQKKSDFIIALLGIVIISICFYLSISSFFALDKVQLSNDFLWMSEQTKLKSSADSNSIQLVDNNNYIMSHGLGGLYQERHSDQMNLARYLSVPAPIIENSLHESLVDAQMLKLDHIIYSNLAVSAQALKSGQSQNQKLTLLKTVGVEPDAPAVILKAQGSGPSGYSLVTSFWPSLSKEEQDFLRKNSYELHNQVTVGHYFYHQYAMLGPVSELLLGKPSNEIVYLYGYGNTHLLAHILHAFSPVSFEKFLAASGACYLLYFVLIVICALVIFRQPLWVLSAIAASTGCLWLIGFESIHYGSGFNPIRHLLDLPLLLFIYAYLRSQKFAFAWLVITNILLLIATWANLQFGLMMLLSFTAVVIIFNIINRSRLIDYVIQLASLVCAGIYFHWLGGHTAQDGLGVYSILGVSVAPIATSAVALCLLYITLGYLGLFGVLRWKGKQYDKLYLILFTLFYTQCIWLYFIWYTNISHFMSVSIVGVFGFLLLLREASDYIAEKVSASLGRIEYFISFCLLLFCLIAGSVYFFFMSQYNKVFEEHRLYHWSFKHAHFVSTMNPDKVQSAVNAINDYASSLENSIYIISKYDSLLPFLANKYTAMPYLELATSLISSDQVSLAQQAILEAQPKYLFVDTDIKKTGFGDIVDSTSPTADLINEQGLSYGRVLVLQMLREVFNGIESDYRPILQTELITVYEHR